jgi:putative ABC transport system permease protein
MALVLLVGAGLMLKSVLRLRAVDPGFRVDGLLTAGISAGSRPRQRDTLTLYRRILDEVARLPGVSAIGATTTLPLSAASMSGSSFQIRSRPRPDSAPPLFTMHAGVTAGFFETLAVPLLDGRPPSRTDEDERRPVAWVNRTFAQQFLDGRAVGERIKLEDDWLEIVGVFGDLRTSGLGDEIRPMVYLPLSNASVKPDALFAVVRSGSEPAALAATLRSAIERIDPSLPVTARTMPELINASMAQKTFVVTLLAIAAGIGLLLGVVGLYGAISYIAAQRAAEIGLRLALGARPSSVCAMVVRQGTLVAIAGIAVGLAAAWASARFLSSMLFGVSAHDPGTYAGVALLLVGVSAAATYLPARRAAAIDPAQTLRREA